MPNGFRNTFGRNRRSYAASSRAARSAAVAAKRAGNKAVAKKLRRPKPRARTKVGRNTNAIVTLARQVRQLQLADKGEFQRNYEVYHLPDAVHFNSTHPLLFALNDMQRGTLHEQENNLGHDSHHARGAPVWIGKLQPQSGSTQPYPFYEQASRFYDYTQEFGHGENEAYSYWKTDNDQTASKVSYCPIANYTKIQTRVHNLNHGETIWFRIDVIRRKRTRDLQFNGVQKKALPNNVCNLSQLCVDDMTQRNRINRSYYEIVKTKWVKHTNMMSTTAIDSHKISTIGMRFKQMKKRPEERLFAGELVTVPQTTLGHNDPDELETNFYSQMDQCDIYWCLVNTSHPGDDTKCKVDMTRYISWRDTQMDVRYEDINTHH